MELNKEQMDCTLPFPGPFHTMEGFAPPPPPPRVQMPPSFAVADPDEMNRIFHLCRQDQWEEVLRLVEQNPWVAMNPIIMDNHISTTIIHQAITSKGEAVSRARVVSCILKATPQAASIKNGYGSLPLHVITQRNTKIKANVKEGLIRELVYAYPGALFEEGGTGRRTPLHIIFTDYISPALTKMMVDHGAQACFMKDKKGWLPAHVACSRHCSPEKLRMLLAVNPGALYERTNQGETLSDLAKSTATKSHPNYALIEEVNRQHASSVAYSPTSAFQSPNMVHQMNMHAMPISDHSDVSVRSRLDSSDSGNTLTQQPWGHETRTVKVEKKRPRKRKATEDNATQALLLLSRDMTSTLFEDDDEDRPTQIARI